MTLIEILVVVAVTMLLSMIGFPAMQQSAQSLSVAQARVRLIGDLRVAQGLARRSGRPVAFAPDRDGHGYAVDRERQTLPDTVRVATETGSPVVFQPDGSVRGTMVLFASGGQTPLQMHIDAVTGVISIQEPRP